MILLMATGETDVHDLLLLWGILKTTNFMTADSVTLQG